MRCAARYSELQQQKQQETMVYGVLLGGICGRRGVGGEGRSKELDVI